MAYVQLSWFLKFSPKSNSRVLIYCDTRLPSEIISEDPWHLFDVFSCIWQWMCQHMFKQIDLYDYIYHHVIFTFFYFIVPLENFSLIWRRLLSLMCCLNKSKSQTPFYRKYLWGIRQLIPITLNHGQQHQCWLRPDVAYVPSNLSNLKRFLMAITTSTIFVF